jgi:hypothetical protein
VVLPHNSPNHDAFYPLHLDPNDAFYHRISIGMMQFATPLHAWFDGVFEEGFSRVRGPWYTLNSKPFHPVAFAVLWNSMTCFLLLHETASDLQTHEKPVRCAKCLICWLPRHSHYFVFVLHFLAAEILDENFRLLHDFLVPIASHYFELVLLFLLLEIWNLMTDSTLLDL